ncbi:MAG: hypothetical protein IKO57_00325 [Treponema sp.]|nr:hypothetical protein [Treponema sp.]
MIEDRRKSRHEIISFEKRTNESTVNIIVATRAKIRNIFSRYIGISQFFETESSFSSLLCFLSDIIPTIELIAR